MERFFALTRNDGKVHGFGKFADYDRAMTKADGKFDDDWLQVWSESDLKNFLEQTNKLF